MKATIRLTAEARPVELEIEGPTKLVTPLGGVSILAENEDGGQIQVDFTAEEWEALA
jgi:hypothetical protein